MLKNNVSLCTLCNENAYLVDQQSADNCENSLKDIYRSFKWNNLKNFGVCPPCAHIVQQVSLHCKLQPRKTLRGCCFDNRKGTCVNLNESTKYFLYMNEYIKFIKYTTRDNKQIICFECVYNIKNWFQIKEQLKILTETDEPKEDGFDLKIIYNEQLSHLKSTEQIVNNRRHKIRVASKIDQRMWKEITCVVISRNDQVLDHIAKINKHNTIRDKTISLNSDSDDVSLESSFKRPRFNKKNIRSNNEKELSSFTGNSDTSTNKEEKEIAAKGSRILKKIKFYNESIKSSQRLRDKKENKSAKIDKLVETRLRRQNISKYQEEKTKNLSREKKFSDKPKRSKRRTQIHDTNKDEEIHGADSDDDFETDVQMDDGPKKASKENIVKNIKKRKQSEDDFDDVVSMSLQKQLKSDDMDTIRTNKTRLKRKSSKTTDKHSENLDKFICNTCEKEFSINSDYKLHKLSHEKPGKPIVNVTRNVSQKRKKVSTAEMNSLINKWVDDSDPLEECNLEDNGENCQENETETQNATEESEESIENKNYEKENLNEETPITNENINDDGDKAENLQEITDNDTESVQGQNDDDVQYTEINNEMDQLNNESDIEYVQVRNEDDLQNTQINNETDESNHEADTENLRDSYEKSQDKERCKDNKKSDDRPETVSVNYGENSEVDDEGSEIIDETTESLGESGKENVKNEKNLEYSEELYENVDKNDLGIDNSGESNENVNENHTEDVEDNVDYSGDEVESTRPALGSSCSNRSTEEVITADTALEEMNEDIFEENGETELNPNTEAINGNDEGVDENSEGIDKNDDNIVEISGSSDVVHEICNDVEDNVADVSSISGSSAECGPNVCFEKLADVLANHDFSQMRRITIINEGNSKRDVLETLLEHRQKEDVEVIDFDEGDKREELSDSETIENIKKMNPHPKALPGEISNTYSYK